MNLKKIPAAALWIIVIIIVAFFAAGIGLIDAEYGGYLPYLGAAGLIAVGFMIINKEEV